MIEDGSLRPEVAARQGLILVDTKYEFGIDENDELVLIDEIHTPDSSRFWQLASYEERFKKGEEPQYFDKEFLRLWFKEHCDPYKDERLPDAPAELVEELSRPLPNWLFVLNVISNGTLKMRTVILQFCCVATPSRYIRMYEQITGEKFVCGGPRAKIASADSLSCSKSSAVMKPSAIISLGVNARSCVISFVVGSNIGLGNR